MQLLKPELPTPKGAVIAHGQGKDIPRVFPYNTTFYQSVRQAGFTLKKHFSYNPDAKVEAMYTEQQLIEYGEACVRLNKPD